MRASLNYERKVIESFERLANSPMGNPAFRIIFADGTKRRTAANAMVAHALPNSEYLGAPVVVGFNNRGQVSTLTVVQEG
jgi:hypothetical protein